MTRSPVRLRPAAPGKWNLVIDLGGRPGKVEATFSVQKG
jgi:hypothetical protein